MAPRSDNQPTIVIKRVKKVEGGHHGGAWKVAYADFVTAMMAFFLLLWLLNATSEAQKQGIADYFDPVSVSESTSGAGGVLGGQTVTQDGRLSPPGGVPTVLVQIDPDTAQEGETRETPAVTGLAQQGTAQSGERSSAVATPAPGDQSALSALEAARQREAEATQKAAAAEERRFETAAEAIRQAIRASPELAAVARQILIDVTPEGMRIQLVDQPDRPMFETGSARMSAALVELLHKLAPIINRLPNRLSIAGHTDAMPYRNSVGYSNWELSADRANSTRRILVEAGIPAGRLYQVSGKADSEPLLPDNPQDAVNRRISIILLREVPVLPPSVSAAPAAP